MTGKYTRLTRQEIEKIVKEPATLGKIGSNTNGQDKEILEIQMEWQGMQFLLSDNLDREAKELSFAVLRGHPIGDLNLKWVNGPPLYQTPEEVKQACELFQGRSAEDISRQFNPLRISDAKRFPGIWEEDNRKVEEAVKHLGIIVDFFRKAEVNDQGVIFWID